MTMEASLVDLLRMDASQEREYCAVLMGQSTRDTSNETNLMERESYSM